MLHLKQAGSKSKNASVQDNFHFPSSFIYTEKRRMHEISNERFIRSVYEGGAKKGYTIFNLEDRFEHKKIYRDNIS